MKKAYNFRVDFVVKANGNCPSKEFYDNLGIAVRAKFIGIAKRIDKSPNGCLRDTDKLEKLKGKHANNLWEMKVWHDGNWYRMLCFRDGPDWWLTHGFVKKSNDTPISEIKKGVAIQKEHYEKKNTRYV